MDVQKGIDLLFQRPFEPVFTPKDDGKAVLEMPDSFYEDEYKDALTSIQNRFGSSTEVKIPVRDIEKPDLSFVAAVAKTEQFSLFNDVHKEVAAGLIKIYLDAPDVTVFLAVAAYTRARTNAVLFQYSFSVAAGHRNDMENYKVPLITEVFPTLFVDPQALPEARREANAIEMSGNRAHVEIPRNYTASPREGEQRLAYFREDIGVNMHHWHWHLVYPTTGPREIVDKDRRGELFYYMHHQILARYNADRLSQGLTKVKPIQNFREALNEGYFPKILSSVNNRTYPGREPDVVLKDVDRIGSSVEIAELERWRNRLHEAIDQGFITDKNMKVIPLDEVHGTDILGNLVESTDLSMHRQFYGNLHNMSHNIVSLAHDPDGRYLEDFGVLADVATAMRDPAFYRIHEMVDAIFTRHKNTLTPYERQKLTYDGVRVDAIEMKMSIGKNPAANVLLTCLQKSDIDLGAALDFGPKGQVLASFEHLQHVPFNYRIKVLNMGGAPCQGTCRIFMLPKSDERGVSLPFNDIRLLAIEMDKFTVSLKPGENIIMRRSTESSITIPYERTFRRIGQADQPTDPGLLAKFRFCGCGWPQHMLLPRGTETGTPYDVFVMISDFKDDMVDQPENGPDLCGDAHSFCGLKDKKYPDKRAMGFPFDRRANEESLEEFVNGCSNMKLQQVTIRYRDEVVDRI